MISSDQYANLSSLYFNIGGVSYELTPNAQIWPRSLNSDIGGTSDGIYLIVGDSGSDSGSGLDFVNGHGFLYAACFLSKQLTDSPLDNDFTRCSTQQTPKSGSPRPCTPTRHLTNRGHSREIDER